MEEKIFTEVFHIPFAIDLMAVAFGALQGALFTMGFKKVDIFGVILIGVLTGIGGGFIRDTLLNVQVATLHSNYYLLTAIIAGLISIILPKLLRKIDPLVIFFDAISLGLFMVLGITKSLTNGLPALPALFVGMLSAVGGGVLRDIVLNLPIALMRVGSLYAVAALVGGGALLALLNLGVNVTIAGVIAVVITTVVRMLSVFLGWSLPEQRDFAIRLRRRKKMQEKTLEAIRTEAITLPFHVPDIHPDPDNLNIRDTGAEDTRAQDSRAEDARGKNASAKDGNRRDAPEPGDNEAT